LVINKGRNEKRHQKRGQATFLEFGLINHAATKFMKKQLTPFFHLVKKMPAPFLNARPLFVK
jgi:hypothetical protein